MSESSSRPGGTPEGAIEVDAPQKILTPAETHDASPGIIVTAGSMPDGTGFVLLRSSEAVSDLENEIKYFQRRWWDGPTTIHQTLELMIDALVWYTAHRGTTSS